MKSTWRVILVIVLVAIIFGGICLCVGMMTGADMSRIYTMLDKQFNLTELYKYFTVDVPAAVQDAGLLP